MTFLNNKPEVDKSWSLFLDRDGVINVESVGSYITTWSEFAFHDGVFDAMHSLDTIFGPIVDALREINANMRKGVGDNGGRIDKVYSCTALSDDDHNRKPNTGMGEQAQQDYPEIDFKRSIMVGNSISDMEFGKRLGMHTVFLTSKHAPYAMPHDFIDEQYASLIEWAKELTMAEMEG
jgi:D-glycero-D-manno-heptose 1,7-bisphosphate phosphatase